MKKSNYLVSIQDPRHPQTEPFVFSASESDVPSILFQFSGCVVIIRELKSFSNLKPQNNETTSEKESC
ncbi:MAG: hypothetical protein JNG52_05850 [Muribaculaceae bacterium]|nr:hypothetical protein [Muribaculaceae bacterium]